MRVESLQLDAAETKVPKLYRMRYDEMANSVKAESEFRISETPTAQSALQLPSLIFCSRYILIVS